MPITIDETIITFADAVKELPRRRRGRKVHVSCIYRWSTSGCRGVVLETLQVGGTRCTSREALQRSSNNSLSLGTGGGDQKLIPGHLLVAGRWRNARSKQPRPVVSWPISGA